MRATRRDMLLAMGAGMGTLALPQILRAQAAAHVAVVGGGFGGATAARYLRRLIPDLRITLVEPQPVVDKTASPANPR